MKPWSSFWTARWAPLLAGGVIVVAALIAYQNSFSVPFLFDDREAITENSTIRHLWPIGRVLSPPAGGLTVSGRPVVNLSLAVNFALGGTAVWGYHAFNLAVHILASLTLLGIVRRTLLQPGLRERFGAGALPLGLAVALLWALHPLQTESVTYVVQRAESLMGLFYLLTLYGFIRGVASPGRGWFGVSVLACVLGMGTKEVMVTAPLLVWLFDRTFVAGTFLGALRARWQVYLGLGSGWLVLAYLVARTGELGSERAGMQTMVSWGSYGLTQFWAVVRYLRLSVWPHPLVFDYGTMLVTQLAQVVPAALVVVLLIAGTVASLKRWPALGFLGCWLFAILAPTTSVLPLAGQTAAEHRMYLSLAAVVTVVVLSVYQCVGRRSLVFFLALAVGSSWLTFLRNRDYRSELAIWNDTVAKQTDNPRAQDNLGFALAQQGRVLEAVEHYQQSIRINADYANARNNFGVALFQLGRISEAVEQYEAALRLKPNYAEAHNNLGAALFQLGRAPEAIVHHETALRIKPDFAQAYYSLGTALLQQGKVAEAIARLQHGLRCKSDDAIAHNNLGIALLKAGQVPEAIDHYEQALRINPGYADARINLAWVLATSGDGSVRDGARAVHHAEQVNPLSGGSNAEVLDTLAAAYAEAARFGEAVRTAQAALDLARVAGLPEQAREIQERLQLYQAGRPYHQGATAKP